MSQGQSLSTSTILLIEADPSFRRLIMLGLCHSGIHVIAASSIQELPALDTQTPDLLIIDVDQGIKSDWSLLSTLHEQPHIATLPIIALSWESPIEDKAPLSTSLFSSFPFLSSTSRRGPGSVCLPGSKRMENLTYLAKPFDARTLHNTITRLLAERAAQKAAQLAIVEAQVLASYERHAAPSIWPIVTAAGVFLMVIGLLLHFILVIVGIMLILASLLLWTLGTKPAPSIVSSTASSSL